MIQLRKTYILFMVMWSFPLYDFLKMVKNMEMHSVGLHVWKDIEEKTSLFVKFLLNLFSLLIFSPFIRYSHLESVEPFVTLAITSEGWKGIFHSDISKQALIFIMTILLWYTNIIVSNKGNRWRYSN